MSRVQGVRFRVWDFAHRDYGLPGLSGRRNELQNTKKRKLEGLPKSMFGIKLFSSDLVSRK